MFKSTHILTVWDYLVFGGLFLISGGIGIFFAIRGRNRDADHYLMGGRRMHGLPVALSLTASYTSAITIVGTPSEFYFYGTMFIYNCIGYVILAIVASEIYIPLFCRLKITSTYEYLEMRFDRKVRLISSTIFIINQIMYSGFAIYAPALALNAATGLNLWASVFTTGIVCTIYTSLGGLKAVVWTDVFQCVMMCVGFLAIIAQGSLAVGGIGNVFDIAQRRGRIDFNHFEADPRIRHTFWSVVIGGSFYWSAQYCTTQTIVQRYLCCKNEKHAKMAVFLNSFGIVFIVSLAGLSGVTMFAYYSQCDPYSAGWVKANDQLMPYFVMEILHKFPGLPGVYLSSAFSGTLSTVSSTINAMAAVTLQDYVKPFKTLSKTKEIWLSKILVIFYGGACLALVALAAAMGDVLTTSLSIGAVIMGPTLGLFTMGWGFPWVNPAVSETRAVVRPPGGGAEVGKGAICGVVAGVFATTSCVIGKTHYPVPRQFTRKMDLLTSGCVFDDVNSTYVIGSNVTNLLAGNGTTNDYSRPLIAEVFALSYTYYSCLGFLVAVIVGNIVSFLTGFQNPSELPPGVTVAFFDHPVFAWLPEKVRRTLRFGIDYSRDRGAGKEEKKKMFEMSDESTSDKSALALEERT